MAINGIIITKGNKEFPSASNQIQEFIEKEIHCLEDYDEIVLRLNQFYEYGITFQNVSFGLLERIRREYVDRLNITFQKERERLLETKPKKKRFTMQEVSEITGKTEGTLRKYFDNEIIKAHKDSSGRWYVLREDLSDFLGHDDF